jgi:hypothetical protein
MTMPNDSFSLVGVPWSQITSIALATQKILYATEAQTDRRLVPRWTQGTNEFSLSSYSRLEGMFK